MGLTAAESGRLIALGAPIICLDTCTILDVMRDPCRDTAQAHNALASMQLLKAIESKTSLVALLADQVQAELNDHLPDIELEAVGALTKLKARVHRVDAIAAVFGVPASANLRHWDQHVTRTKSAVDRWIKGSEPAPQSPNVQNHAFARVMQVRSPARKGKDSLQDCVVLETYLEVVRDLRSQGLTSKVVLASSNTSDYAVGTTGQLKPDLAVEFAALGMEYAQSFGLAKYLLGV